MTIRAVTPSETALRADIGTGVIQSLLTPKSIAVIGAAPAEQRTIRGSLLRVLRRGGFDGRIVPVNPSYKEINGIRCYPSITAVGFAVDLAVHFSRLRSTAPRHDKESTQNCPENRTSNHTENSRAEKDPSAPRGTGNG